MNDKLYRKFVLLNKIGWALVILSFVAFLGLALVCKYRQVHYNENTGDLFVKGFFSLGVLLSTGLLIGFPKTFCDVGGKLKAAQTKRTWLLSFIDLVCIGFSFLGAVSLLVCSIIFIKL